MNINVTLRRAPDGRFRPNMPEPTSAEEAKRYREAMTHADTANDFFQAVQKEMTELQKADNTSDDFNSTEGVVVTSSPFKGADSRDKLVQSSALNFTPSSGAVTSYDRQIEGTTFRAIKGGAAGQNLKASETTTYSSGPLFLELKHLTTLPEISSRRYEATRTLEETGDGLIQFTQTETNTLSL